MFTAVKISDLPREARAWLSTPLGFVIGRLGLKPYDCEPQERGQPMFDRNGQPLECRGKDGQLFYRVVKDDWQARFFHALADHGARIAVKTANGAGKSSMLVAGALLWHMATFPNSKTVIYSASHRQLQTQLWPSILAQVPKCPGWEFQQHTGVIRAPNGARAVIFATNDPGKAEGHHGNKEPLYDILSQPGPLLIMIDEAKTVPVSFFEAFDRCTYQRLVYLSSTGSPEGDFYKAMKAESAFVKIEAPASVCPHADHAKNAEIIAKRGLDHPLVQSTIFAKFMEDVDGGTISWKDVERSLRAETRHQPGRRTAFCDFAAGGDENCLAICDGNKPRIDRAWRENDTIRAAGEFAARFHANRLQASDIYADASGIGTVFCDALSRLGWDVHRVFNQGKANRAEFSNIASEMWSEFCDAVRRGEICMESLRDDETFVAQLVGRKFKFGDLGKIRVEPKDEMKARGLESPDRAEAVVGACYFAGAHRQSASSELPPLPDSIRGRDLFTQRGNDTNYAGDY